MLEVVGRASAQAAVLVLVVLLVQWAFRKQLTPRWRCALWLLVAVRLLLPFSFASATSVFNFLPQWSAHPQPRAVSAPQALEPDSKLSPNPKSRPKPNHARPAPGAANPTQAGPGTPPQLSRSIPVSWPAVIFWSWVTGASILLGQVLLSTVRMSVRFGRLPPLTDPKVLEVLEQCRKRLGVRAAPPVSESGEISTPALHGFLRPRLLLPKGFGVKFSARELQFIFLHELAHLKRHDLILNWIMTLLQVAHWFNPLVWLAFARWRADRELACDALALEAVGAAKNREYGQTILRLLEGFTYRTAVPGLAGILEDKRELRQRIQMIARFQPGSRSTLAVLLVGVIAVVCLTDPKLKELKADQLGGTSRAENEPLALDLQPFYQVAAEEAFFKPIAGRQWIGGLPFGIDGQAFVCRSQIVPDEPDRPPIGQTIQGIEVNRKFQELDLIHHTVGAEAAGQVVARVQLNCTDGTQYQFPIRYGVHILDCNPQAGEQAGQVALSEAEVAWHEDNQSGARLFKTRLVNPFPDKEVKNIDVYSERGDVAYVLVAATVASFDRATATSTSALDTATVAGGGQSQSSEPAPASESEAKILDLARFQKPFDGYNRRFEMFDSVLGRRTFDGVPFQINGHGILFGQTFLHREVRAYPETFDGIRIDRKFDELHLIHYTKWLDMEGTPLARIRLNYLDGSTHEFQMVYGEHVRDWLQQPNEEKEEVSDPDTKVIWRGPGPAEYSVGTARLFKSTLLNPYPEKTVASMDVITTRRLASYVLIAATVSSSDPSRAVTPAMSWFPTKNYAGRLTVRVMDATTGAPVAGAACITLMNGSWAEPLYMSSTGEGTLRYPAGQTRNIAFDVHKTGYKPQSFQYSADTIPNEVTVWLVRGESEWAF